MNRETYGLFPENPVRLNSTQAAMAYLNSLVTKNESHHILFHRLMSLDFNIFEGKGKSLDNTVDIYEICTNNETIFTIFINIHCNECLWIPPAPFDFEYDVICIVDKEMTSESEAEIRLVSVEKKYVSEIRSNWEIDDYDKYYPVSMDHILFCNRGVNYKVNHFPYDLWVSYLKENIRCVSELTKEQLEIREMAKAEYERNKIITQTHH
jgi:hypothetical protein